jgi:hypothetical protein
VQCERQARKVEATQYFRSPKIFIIDSSSMSSNSSIHLRKKPTEQKRYSLTASCTKRSLTFDSATPSSISRNQKEGHSKNSVTFHNRPETQQRQYSSTSYAQTPTEYSQYQTIYLSELPSPHSWPSENTIPSREQMDYDLQGLSYQTQSSPPQYFAVAPEQTTGCPYHRTSLGLALEASRLGRGLSVMDRWMLEDGSESGVMFIREGTGRMSIDNGCSCALVEGSGDEMANWEES